MTSWNSEILMTYGLKTSVNESQTMDKLKQTKGTFKIISEVWNSNRHPYTVMIIAAKVGMYIPYIHRTGILAFNFFMKNIRHYEHTFRRKNKLYPSSIEIFLSRNKLDLLMQFRDDEILTNGVKWDSDYSDRKDMLTKFIQNNVNSRGVFYVESCSRSSFSPNARILVYTEGSSRLAFNIEELGKAIDIQRKVVWKSSNEYFDTITLLGLRKSILEKFGQWKDRVGYIDGPNELLALVHKLDEILPGPISDVSSYLSSPGF